MYIGNSGNKKIMYQRVDRRGSKRKFLSMILLCLQMFSAGCFFIVFILKIFEPNGYVVVDSEWITAEQEKHKADNILLENIEAIPKGDTSASVTYVDVIDRVLPVQPDTDLIVIDPGHGGEDEGCRRGDVNEKDINLQLALSLQAKLIEKGYEVIMTRSDDVELSLDERIEIANSSDADIYISIHQNAYEGKAASGIETWYSGGKFGKDSSRLAKLLHSNLLEETESVDRGLQKTEELKVIRETKMPACLVETGFLSNAAERELLMNPEYQAQIVEGLADGIELYFHPKTMYLTFDDGPSAENTDAILDILKEKNVKATFFVIGENVKKHPEVAKRIVEEGHTIGIHCYNHAYDTLYASVDSYIADFEAAQDIVYQVTGVEADIFRFPGGSINSFNEDVYLEIIEEMEKRGYTYYDWNASLEDVVSKNNPEQLIQNAKNSTLGRKRIIMLAHDTVENTALCLEALLDEFPEYKMETLNASVKPIQF